MPGNSAPDVLIRATMADSGEDEGQAIAMLKSAGLIRQHGRSLLPTRKGLRSARAARRRKRGISPIRVLP